MSDPTTAIARFVRWVMRDVTFDRVYSARVDVDHGDETLDVTSDDDALRGTSLQRVPVLVGVAGARVRAVPGTVCLLGFGNRDPRFPRIVGWGYQSGKARIAFDGGIAGLARQGDPVRMLVSEGATVAGTMSGQTTIPGTPPVITPVPLAPFIGVVTGVDAARDLFAANILGGARKLTA